MNHFLFDSLISMAMTFSGPGGSSTFAMIINPALLSCCSPCLFRNYRTSFSLVGKLYSNTGTVRWQGVLDSMETRQLQGDVPQVPGIKSLT